jgi:hypothetical protein
MLACDEAGAPASIPRDFQVADTAPTLDPRPPRHQARAAPAAGPKHRGGCRQLPRRRAVPECSRSRLPDGPLLLDCKINADVAVPFMSEFAHFEGRH